MAACGADVNPIWGGAEPEAQWLLIRSLPQKTA
jgi:hypothetical protein